MEPMVLSVREGESLVGIAPLMRKGDCISFIGDTNVCDYMDFIVAPGREDAALSAIFEYLEREEWFQLDLHCIPERSPTSALLPRLYERDGVGVAVEPEDVCPIVQLPATWEEYLITLSKKDRHELRRKLRRLDGAGSVRHYSAGDDEGLPQAMEDFLRLHRQSREDKAAFMTDKMQDFFKAFTTKFVSMGLQRLYFLELDGVRISSTICFDYKNTLYLYNSGYDTEYAHLSVGLLLKSLCLKDALEEGKKVFDFLRGDEPYKYDLGGRDTAIYNHVITRSSSSGAVTE